MVSVYPRGYPGRDLPVPAQHRAPVVAVVADEAPFPGCGLALWGGHLCLKPGRRLPDVAGQGTPTCPYSVFSKQGGGVTVINPATLKTVIGGGVECLKARVCQVFTATLI